MRWPATPLTATTAKAAWAVRAMVCALLVAAQALLFSHTALVSHRTCALHGESVHAGAHVASEHEVIRAPVAATASHAQADEHDHCIYAAQARERLLLSSPGELCEPIAAQVLVAGPATVAEPVVRELWSLAPKNSPPA